MNQMKTIAILPARYKSKRFPGKVLYPIAGTPMIKYVIDGIEEAGTVDQVYVATDDDEIAAYVSKLGTEAIMTSTAHQSGTERILEAVNEIGDDWDFLINVQGDEPLIGGVEIDELVTYLRETDLDIATLARPITSQQKANSSHVVKVTFDKSHRAHYFSRSLIPYPRNNVQCWYQHIGIYGFTKTALRRIRAFSETALERSENLEQLRWLDHGLEIGVVETDIELIGVDVPADIEAVEQRLSKE